jgi:hypothetical protein
MRRASARAPRAERGTSRAPGRSRGRPTGGTGSACARRASPPGPARGAPGLRWHRPSTTGSTGRATAAPPARAGRRGWVRSPRGSTKAERQSVVSRQTTWSWTGFPLGSWPGARRSARTPGTSCLHPVSGLEGFDHNGLQFSPRQSGRRRRRPDEVSPGPPLMLRIRDDGAQPAAKPVALNSGPHRPPDGIRHSRRKGGIFFHKPYRDGPLFDAAPRAPEPGERGPVAYPPDRTKRRREGGHGACGQASGSVRPRGAGGLCAAGPSGWLVPPAWTSGDENHDSWHVCDCLAGRSASPVASLGVAAVGKRVPSRAKTRPAEPA